MLVSPASISVYSYQRQTDRSAGRGSQEKRASPSSEIEQVSRQVSDADRVRCFVWQALNKQHCLRHHLCYPNPMRHTHGHRITTCRILLSFSFIFTSFSFLHYSKLFALTVGTIKWFDDKLFRWSHASESEAQCTHLGTRSSCNTQTVFFV